MDRYEITFVPVRGGPHMAYQLDADSLVTATRIARSWLNIEAPGQHYKLHSTRVMADAER